MKKISEKKKLIIIFTLSMFFCLIIGIMLSYNFEFITNFNLLFESDSSRVIGDMSEIGYYHYRLKVHPLFVLFTQPIYFLVKGLVLNRMLSLVIISSIVTSLTVVYIYKILSIYSNNEKIKILVIISYLLSFSNIIFTAGIEIYNIAVLFLVMLWYYILSKKNFSKDSCIILILLGILSIAFTITNIVVFLIALFVLLIFKKIKIKNVIIITLSTITISIGLIYFQNAVWHNTPTLSKDNYKEEKNFIVEKVGFNNLGNVIRDNYYNSLLSSDIYLKIEGEDKNYTGSNYIITFDDKSVVSNIVLSLFYLSGIVLLIRNYPKNKLLNTGFILALLFNTILHTIYGNSSPFLYSLHFIYLIFIPYGVNLLNEENKLIKKIGKYILILLVLFELIINTKYFIKVLMITETVLNSNYFVANLGLLESLAILIIILSIILFIVYLIIRCIKKISNKKSKENIIINIVIISGLVLLIHCIFFALETADDYHKLFWFNIGNKNGIVHPNEHNEYIKIDKKKLEANFKDEVKALNEYKLEYQEFLNNYSHNEIDFLNNSEYYFFGLGNRKKYLYKEGNLIDLDTSLPVYKYKVKSSEIIPNIYTVIIEDMNGNFIKLYEDEKGVHCSVNGNDVIVSGTNNYLNLYKFEGEKYQNIKKVLYSEILFNIKNSVIYPNILVYDMPWYRDAALATMVLKYTNNLDLITNWVNNIRDIYDYQNKGVKEPDNLGELLYILSTQKDKNEQLINKIIKEAESIAKKNPKGYYLTGLTDYSSHSIYQSLWYKLGITSNNKKYNFITSNEEDGYAQLAWWSDNIVDENILASENPYFPYLSLATYHKVGKGTITLNGSIYPLSWERGASEAKYQNMKIVGDYYADNAISPLHVWTASELLLLILDETGNLK